MLFDDGICDCCDCSLFWDEHLMCRDEKEEVRRTWSNVCEAKNTETLRKIVQEYKEKERALAIAQNAKNKKRAFSKIKSLLHSMTKAFIGGQCDE